MSAPTLKRPTLPKVSLPKREHAVPRSQKERLWLVVGGMIAFVMLLIGYFFFISPQRSNTAQVNTQAATVQQQNVLLQARLDALREQNKNLPQVQAELANLQQALPSASGISDFVRTLQSLGSATLTDVTALTVGEPVTVTLAPAAPLPATSETSAAPTDTTTSSTVATAPGLYGLPITATVTGSAAGLTKFLDQLQAVQPRAVRISDVSVTNDSTTGGNTYTLNLTMQAFVAPVGVPGSAALPVSAVPSPTS
jgi:type IV pilus assembly protein PilO